MRGEARRRWSTGGCRPTPWRAGPCPGAASSMGSPAHPASPKGELTRALPVRLALGLTRLDGVVLERQERQLGVVAFEPHPALGGAGEIEDRGAHTPQDQDRL